ncbi:MAG: lamin tail domain-containing protein [Puniceicoccaceae bacterium]
MKKSLLTLAAGSLLAALPASGQLLITEIASKGDFGQAEDYFEITNLGTSTVDMTGWQFSDEDGLPEAVDISTSIAPNASVVFVEVLTASEFRDDWWGIDSSVQVVTHDGKSLGKNDEVNIYDDNDDLQLSLSYAAGDFTKENGDPSDGDHAGISAGGSEDWEALVWVPSSGTTNPRYTFAQAGQLGAFQAADGADIGSPGAIPEPDTFGALAGALALGFAALRRRRRS